MDEKLFKLWPNTRFNVTGIALIGFCLLAAGSVGYFFGMALIRLGLSTSIPQFIEASEKYLWVRGVMVDFIMFNIFVSIWFFYREKTVARALLAVALFWAAGSIFMGLYIAALWLRSGSIYDVLLGKHALYDGAEVHHRK